MGGQHNQTALLKFGYTAFSMYLHSFVKCYNYLFKVVKYKLEVTCKIYLNTFKKIVRLDVLQVFDIYM